MPPKPYALIVENVNKYFKDERETMRLRDLLRFQSTAKKFHSVKEISFKVKQGEIFGILGPNGCGKSTLIRMMTTLVTPDSGSIEIFGVDVQKNPGHAKDLIGRVSVDASFFRKLSALENLDYAAGLYGLERTSARKRIKNLLLDLGFPKEKMTLCVEKLSRGQQQKVAIARGFLAHPKVLLLDEPTTGLDPVSKIDVQRFIRKVMKDEDITIVITSHDMEEIDKLCDRLVIMEEGKLVAKGSPAQLKMRHCENSLYELKTTHLVKTKRILAKMRDIRDVQLSRDQKRERKLLLHVDDIDRVAPFILHALKTEGIGFVSLTKVLPTLEDVFVKITGRHLSDAKEE
jgi:ABC-2 type transport system ATP-binding protein